MEDIRRIELRDMAEPLSDVKRMAFNLYGEDRVITQPCYSALASGIG
jgi:hypothetical protein